VFVSDPHQGRVWHWNAFGRLLGTLGQAPPVDGDAGRDRPGVLDRPYAVAVRGDLVYVAGGDQPRRRAVQRFTRQGTLLRPLASHGDAAQCFGAPRGLFADDQGLLVADTLHGTIQRFRGDGTYVGEWRCQARRDGNGERVRPAAVVRRPDGGVVFLDRGDHCGLAGLGPDGRPWPLPSDVAARCVDPVALAGDRKGRLYVLDHGGERVIRFTAALQFDREVCDLREQLGDYSPLLS
jgi:hypothetical protein